MVLLFFHNSAFAQHPTFTRGDLLFTLTYDNNLQRDAVVVSAANKEISGDITIPASITINTNIQNSELLSVIGVLDNGFKECSKITSVIMPNTISTIDRNAFNGCTELKSVSLSDGLTWISEGAFCKLQEFNRDHNTRWSQLYGQFIMWKFLWHYFMRHL